MDSINTFKLSIYDFHPLDNIKSFFQLIGEYHHSPVQHNQLCSFISCPENLWPNFFYDYQFQSKDTSQVIEEITNTNLPPYLLCSESDIPPIIHQGLSQKGFLHSGWESMTFDLAQSICPILIPNLSLIKVRSYEDFQLWCRVCRTSLFKDAEMNFSLLESLFQKPNMDFFLARFKNKPVSVSMLFKNGAEAGIYFVGTLPEFEGRGFARAVTVMAMLEGKKQNCNEAILQATRQGEFVYTKLGYQKRGLISIFKFEF